MMDYAKRTNLNKLVIERCFNNAFKRTPQEFQEKIKDHKLKLKTWMKRFIILPYLIKHYIDVSQEDKDKLIQQLLTIENPNNALQDYTYKQALRDMKNYINTSKINFDNIVSLLMSVFNTNNFYNSILNNILSGNKTDLINLGINCANAIYKEY